MLSADAHSSGIVWLLGAIFLIDSMADSGNAGATPCLHIGIFVGATEKIAAVSVAPH
jgi:hypothetical protein